jgi:GNAT superfamily N-acetyltransferase
MNHLEQLATAGGARRLILQTGDRQPDAVALYERVGYTPIPIYEPYIETIPNSFCFEKVIAR